MKVYTDKAKCPAGHRFNITRRLSSAGSKVHTFCPECRRSYPIRAGAAPKGL
jgi:uncharacterized protein YbaR (Trm112 family)